MKSIVDIGLDTLHHYNLDLDHVEADPKIRRRINDMVETEVRFNNVELKQKKSKPKTKDPPTATSTTGTGTYPDTPLSRAFRYAVLNYVDTQPTTSSAASLGKINFQSDKFEWVWKTARGTLPKRLNNYCYKEYGFSLKPNILSKIGNAFREGYVKGGEIHFDVTKKIDWTSGEFGDHGSCLFRGDKEPGEEIKNLSMNNENFAALRFFKRVSKDVADPKIFNKVYYEDDDAFHVGISRSWIFKPKEEEVELIVFNSYGMQLHETASIVYPFLKERDKDKKDLILKHLYTTGNMYINGSTSYIIADRKYIANKDDLRMSLRNDHY